MTKFLSGRQKNLKIGITSYSENTQVLGVIGRVGIGSTVFDAEYDLDVRGTTKLSGDIILGTKSSNLITVPGRISSNFYPDGDGTYDVGRAPQIGLGANRWKDANFYGKGTFGGGVDANDLELGVGSANLIYSTSGNLELNSQSGITNIDDIVTISGNTGIGTTNPTSKLWVNGDGYFTGVVTSSGFYVDGQLIGGPISGTSIVGTALSISGISTVGFITASNVYVSGVVTATNGFYGNLFGNATSTTYVTYTTYADSSGISTSVIGGIGSITQLRVTGISTFANGPVFIGSTTSTGTASQPLQVTGSTYISGNLGIGTTTPTSKLEVVGNVYVSGILTATDINSASDIRLKTNIKPFENALEKVMQINGVTFDWIENNVKSAGIIAQDVEKVFPELVNNGNHKTVNYNGLIGVLIESIKELKQEIEELKSKLI